MFVITGKLSDGRKFSTSAPDVATDRKNEDGTVTSVPASMSAALSAVESSITASGGVVKSLKVERTEGGSLAIRISKPRKPKAAPAANGTAPAAAAAPAPAPAPANSRKR